ncbi:MAG: SH3 domain-containing protein [Desertifilum sp.]|nr:SH3 domain-containing protein [Desertifilum sp.]
MLSAILKFILGVFFALALLLAGSVAAARYFITKMTAPPPRPVFANDRPAALQSAVAGQSAPTSSAAQPAPAAAPAPKPLPDGAFEARVIWPDGLILREASGPDANRVGGVGYNERVIVLQESGDKAWQKIRLNGSEQEGWVKAGNLERIN